MNLVKIANLFGALTAKNKELANFAKSVGILPKPGTHWEEAAEAVRNMSPRDRRRFLESEWGLINNNEILEHNALNRLIAKDQEWMKFSGLAEAGKNKKIRSQYNEKVLEGGTPVNEVLNPSLITGDSYQVRYDTAPHFKELNDFQLKNIDQIMNLPFPLRSEMYKLQKKSIGESGNTTHIHPNHSNRVLRHVAAKELDQFYPNKEDISLMTRSQIKDLKRLGSTESDIVDPSGMEYWQEKALTPDYFLDYKRPMTPEKIFRRAVHDGEASQIGDTAFFAGLNAVHPENWHRIYNPNTGYQSAQKINSKTSEMKQIIFQHRPQEAGISYVKEENMPQANSNFQEFEAKVRELKKQSGEDMIGLIKLAWLYAA